MEILLGISIIVNVLIIVDRYFTVKVEKDEKKDILNRLMCKDYKEYASIEHVKVVDNKKPVTETLNRIEQDVFPVN